MTTLLLVDDQEVIRAGLRAILATEPDIAIVGEAGDGLSAVRAVAELAPDVVLMDLRMPGIDGVEATRRIRAATTARQVRILVLTTFDEDANVLAALKAGADGFLSKGAGPAELVDAITRVARGDRALSGTAVNAVVAHVAEGPAVPVDADAVRRLSALTGRELEIVTYLVRGLTNREIAAALYLSPLTVKTHVNHAMTKLEARDRAQLVTVAVRAGILP